jgi:hypothetical protein
MAFIDGFEKIATGLKASTLLSAKLKAGQQAFDNSIFRHPEYLFPKDQATKDLADKAFKTTVKRKRQYQRFSKAYDKKMGWERD